LGRSSFAQGGRRDKIVGPTRYEKAGTVVDDGAAMHERRHMINGCESDDHDIACEIILQFSASSIR